MNFSFPIFATMLLRLSFFLLFALIIELYAYQAIRITFENKWIIRIYTIFSLLTVLFLVISFSRFDRTVGQNPSTLMTIGLLLLVYVPKLLIGVFMLFEDVFRLIFGLINHFTDSVESNSFLPNRRKFISQMALAIAFIPFSGLIYGIFKGRYNYKVIKTPIYFDDLPDEFDGFRILQISDLHCGSFDNKEKIQYGIDLINRQDFDILVFTGDLVNTHAEEMDEWYDVFSKIKQGKFGNYSILGNHDYGEYIKWPSYEDKQRNFEGIKSIHPKIGWDLLLNENRIIKKGNSEIALIGVENWGAKFQQKADLAKAIRGVDKNAFKVVLTHDPSHWDLVLQNDPFNFHLTLCGHTHGMQFGIEIPGWIKWSPVQYVYKHWAGLYEKGKRYIYVNRGFGYHAYPGRVGIWPEISILELNKKHIS